MRSAKAMAGRIAKMRAYFSMLNYLFSLSVVSKLNQRPASFGLYRDVKYGLRAMERTGRDKNAS